jgi:hypothetical protein
LTLSRHLYTSAPALSFSVLASYRALPVVAKSDVVSARIELRRAFVLRKSFLAFFRRRAPYTAPCGVHARPALIMLAFSDFDCLVTVIINQKVLGGSS